MQEILKIDNSVALMKSTIVPIPKPKPVEPPPPLPDDVRQEIKDMEAPF